MNRAFVFAFAAILMPATFVYAQVQETGALPPTNPINSVDSSKQKTEPESNERASSSPPSTTGGNNRPPAVKAVIVKAKAPDYRRFVDRRSYSLANDLQTANGSIADALRNVPSVEVDPQGNVSLRGDASVTILVDGQPSVLFQGPNRADMLQQVPANRYDRVEVMTNPSAAYSPDGTGGIINLITKKSRADANTQSATLQSSADTNGGYKASLNESYSANNLSFTGSAGYQRRVSDTSSQSSEQLIDPTSGESADVVTNSSARQVQTGWNLNGALSYRPNSKTTLTSDLAYVTGQARATSSGTYRSSATDGVLAQDYDNAGAQSTHFSGAYGSTSYIRNLQGDGQQFSIRLNYGTVSFASDSRQNFAYELPVQPDLYQSLPANTIQTSAGLKAEYKSPLPDKSTLDSGYELQFGDNSYYNSGALGTNATDAVIDTAITNKFEFTQWVQSAFITYDRALGKFDVMPGMRAEQTVDDSDLQTTGAKQQSSYFEIYPTFHMSYNLNDYGLLTAAYSRRVQRPTAQELNPFRIYSNPLSYSQGNPSLRPQLTDSYELGYEYNKRDTYFLATVYYRNQGDLISNVTENLGGGALLSTWANVGQSRNAGIELTGNKALSKTLSFKLTGDGYWSEIGTVDDPTAGARSAWVFSGHAKLDWTPTKIDFLQATVFARGNQITAQGYQGGFIAVDIGYRHKFGQRLALEILVIDPFDSFNLGSVVDTPTLREHTTEQFRQRAVSLGFSYAFGAAGNQKQSDFDFSAGGATH